MNERLKPQPNLQEAYPPVPKLYLVTILAVGIIGSIAKIASIELSDTVDGSVKTILDYSGKVGGPAALASLAAPFVYVELENLRAKKILKQINKNTQPTNSTN